MNKNNYLEINDNIDYFEINDNIDFNWGIIIFFVLPISLLNIFFIIEL